MTDRPELEQIDHETPDQRDELLNRLEASVPEAFSDGKLDVEVLQTLLGDKVTDGPERFTFTWAGKRDAMAMLQAPSSATLAPGPDNSINFDEAQHVFIEGENLEVLKVLYRSYFGRVKLIYIDPPYNTGNDFIYPDNFADPLDHYLKLTGQRTEDGDDTTSKTETAGRLHSGWLSMMYPRLSLARQFLTDDGVIFVSIDDKELSNLLRLLDEILGEENRVGVISWKNVTDNNPTLINKDNEFIVSYAKSKANLPQSWKSSESDAKEILIDFFETRKGEGKTPEEIEKELAEFIKDNRESLGSLTRYKLVDEGGIYTGSESVHNTKPGGYEFEVIHPVTEKPMRMPANGYRFPEDTFRQMETDEIILFGPDHKRIVKIKKYVQDYQDSLRSVLVMDGRLGTYDVKRLFDVKENLFDNPKPVDLLASLTSFATDGDDLVLDLFAGSGTLAEAVAGLNAKEGTDRKSVSIQMAEQIEEKHFAYKKGFRSIAELSRKRAALAIEANSGSGLRSFILAGGNMKRWTGVEAKDPDAYAAQLEAFTDSLAPGWHAQDVIWEVALREGYSLTAKVEELDIGTGPTFWRVSDEDRRFTICLDEALTLGAVAPLGLTEDDMFVCRDTALDDTLAANLALQCRLKVI
jgi:adenine-specific DNA-methyltransferase